MSDRRTFRGELAPIRTEMRDRAGRSPAEFAPIDRSVGIQSVETRKPTARYAGQPDRLRDEPAESEIPRGERALLNWGPIVIPLGMLLPRAVAVFFGWGKHAVGNLLIGPALAAFPVASLLFGYSAGREGQTLKESIWPAYLAGLITFGIIGLANPLGMALFFGALSSALYFGGSALGRYQRGRAAKVA